MAVTVRERTLPSGDSHWQVDIRVRLTDGSTHRERHKAPGSTRAQALRWARQREAHILRHGPQGRKSRKNKAPRVVVPTFAEFAPRFLQDHVVANRLSPTTQRDYENTIKHHLNPVLGDIRLDRLEARHIQALKRRKLAASTTNKLLNHLKAMLRIAIKWSVIATRPEIAGVKQPERHPRFYDFAEYRALVHAARGLSPETLAAVRLGGDAGLRAGEILGIRWRNVHLDRRKLYICDNLVRIRGDNGEWILRAPKGGRPRWVPISAPLERGIKALERRGEHVLTNNHGRHITPSSLRRRLRTAQRHAGLAPCGPHILRHTFCSHLVLRGVHVRTIQKLAGHAELSTTEVYMHLVSEVEDDAIRRLREDDEEE